MASVKGLRAMKRGPVLVTGPSVALMGPLVSLIGLRFPLWGSSYLSNFGDRPNTVSESMVS